MQNKNYQIGRQKEYNAKKKLESQGYNVLRAAGSKGAFDLIAWNEQHTRFIQIKHTRKKNPTTQKYKKYRP